VDSPSDDSTKGKGYSIHRPETESCHRSIATHKRPYRSKLATALPKPPSRGNMPSGVHDMQKQHAPTRSTY